MGNRVWQFVTLGLIQFVLSQSNTTITYEEYTKPFKNPLKGLLNNQYNSLNHMYINWNQIENSESDGIDKIKSYWEKRTKNAPVNGNKIIPRVQLQDHNGSYWPSDLKSGDYTSEQFKTRLRRLIQRLGEVWDNDPRVALIEMGLIGMWGEHHSPGLTSEMQQLLGEEFQKAFKNKKVSHRYTGNFTNFQFGIYWDSFAHPEDEKMADNWEKLSPRWTTQMMTGEVANNWGKVESYLGNNGSEFYGQDKYFNRFYNFIRWTHTLNLKNMYDYGFTYGSNSTADKNYDTAFNAIGYRYILKEATFPKRINTEAPFNVSFMVTNVGSSPFYYHWPVELSLLNPFTKQVVWKDVFDKVDLRSWLPGDNWQFDKNDASKKGTGYKVPPAIYSETGTFQLTANIPSGEYILAIAVLDPGGGNPGLRFSNKNYYQGGRHPLGKIGINTEVANANVNNSEFSDLQADRLSYGTQVVQYPKVVPLSKAPTITKKENVQFMYRESFNKNSNEEIGKGYHRMFLLNGKPVSSSYNKQESDLTPVLILPRD